MKINKISIYASIICLVTTICLVYLYSPYRLERNMNKVIKFADSIEEENKIGDHYTYNLNKWDSERSNSHYKYYIAMMMEALYKTGHTDFAEYFFKTTYQSNKNTSSQNLKKYIKKEPLDFVMTVKPLLLFDDTKYDMILKQVYQDLQEQETLNKCGNNYRHKNLAHWKKYPFSLDGLYGAIPFVIKYRKKYSPETDYEKWAYERMHWVANNLKLENGLYCHGIKENGITKNGTVWLRAVGWYAMAQVDVIEEMPEGKYRQELINELKSFFDTMISYQNPINGMWENVVYPTKDVNCNRYETSGSAMLSYALIKSYNLGILNDKKYLKAGIKSFNGIVESKLKYNSKNGYILKDTSFATNVKPKPQLYCICHLYYNNDAKGVAPLIFAAGEVQHYLKSIKK